jgi:hypothetical protein
MTHFPHDPVSDPDLSSVWSALRAPAVDEELAEEQRLVALITAHASAATLPHTSRSRMSTMLRIKLATAGLAAALFASSSLAYAGVLPGAAQSTASDMLAKVGITVSGPNSHAGTHPNSRGQSTADANTADQPSAAGHGQTVSQLAKTTTDKGRAKGTSVAATASNGRSTTGRNTAATASNGHSTSGQDTAATASNGHSTSGQDTAATASNGHSTSGQDTAATASNGHSTSGHDAAATASNGHSTTGQDHASSGSGNAPSHP